MLGEYSMKPFEQFSEKSKNKIRYILTDIDDTLTNDGRLPAVAYTAMELLQQTNRRVIPITGRPAGWCDHIARMWPVDSLVGENGAFYFRYDDEVKKMQRRYFKSEAQRSVDRAKLNQLKAEILQNIPDCRVASDQAYREADLAIDYCEDIPALPMEAVNEIVRCFESAGAHAKVSSIHVNGWFGDYDKLTMTQLLFEEVYQENLEEMKSEVLFIGDSPNDAPMFDYFPNSVGVANVLKFKTELTSKPAWMTRKAGGYGFAEMVGVLLVG
jgi:HAD superfamily hydrolase (TIGR01484 family)